MTGVLFMVDSIESPQTTGARIPAAIMSAPAIAGYLHGNSWPTFAPYAAARPDLARAGRVVSITLTASRPARCLDIEPGGATNAEAPAWFRNLADRSHGKPILYTSASNIGALVTTMSRAGIPRNDYLIWSAHYTLRAHICSPATCGFPAADGTQYTDRVPENCDGSVMFDYCFAPAGQPAPTPHPITEEDMITAILKRDGRLEVFVEKKDTGEVFHTFQDQENGGWSGAEAGKRNAAWYSLGTPGK